MDFHDRFIDQAWVTSAPPGTSTAKSTDLDDMSA